MSIPRGPEVVALAGFVSVLAFVVFVVRACDVVVPDPPAEVVRWPAPTDGGVSP